MIITQYGKQLMSNGKIVGTQLSSGLFLMNLSSDDGGNPNPPVGSSTFAWPFPTSSITDGYGYVPGHLNSKHHGVDFGQAVGTPIPVTADGVCSGTYPNSTGGYGNFVEIDHGVLSGGPYAGKECHSMYAHMNAPSPLSVGDKVKQGDIVGPVGATGFVTGPCLHWEIHISDAGTDMVINTTDIDPEEFMKSYGPK